MRYSGRRNRLLPLVSTIVFGLTACVNQSPISVEPHPEERAVSLQKADACFLSGTSGWEGTWHNTGHQIHSGKTLEIEFPAFPSTAPGLCKQGLLNVTMNFRAVGAGDVVQSLKAFVLNGVVRFPHSEGEMRLISAGEDCLSLRYRGPTGEKDGSILTFQARLCDPGFAELIRR